MGNDISSSKDYQIGQPYVSNGDSPVKVTIAPAISSDGIKYTAFQYPKEHGKIDEAAEKHIEIIRTTRHPYILKYCTTVNERSQITLVTENVTPLDVAVETQEKEEVFAGISSILEAVLFLHDRSFVCHNSISVSSIFVTEDGTWKLGSFENSTKVLRLSKQSYDNDISGFAEFALSVLEYLKDDASNTRCFMSKLEEDFTNEKKEILGSLKSLQNDQFFKFPLLDVLNGLQNLTLMSTTERHQFFRSLSLTTSSLSASIISRRIIPKLFTHFVITDPVADEELFLQSLFASGNDYCMIHGIQSLVDMEYFKKSSMPLILSLFDSRDTTIRLIIIKYLALYVDCIKEDVLKDYVLPELLEGLKDTNDDIVTTTFNALGLLIPLLGSKDVVGGERITCFHDGKPDFTRSPRQNGKAPKPEHTVAEILHSKSVTPREKNSEATAEEKRRRREERERQREEQRLRREQRRLERELAKAKRIQTQVSDDSSPSVKSLDIKTTSSTGLEKMPDNMSEPDWEGFEAFSNDESELNTVEHTVFPIEPENDDEWGWNDTTNADTPTTPLPKVLDIKPDENSVNIKTVNEISTSKPKSKGMSLANIKKIKSSSKLNGAEDEKERNNDLGNEFDIKINTEKLASIEPDYFADMIPSIEKQDSSSTIVVDAKANEISSKFSAMDFNSLEPSGWSDGDDGDGWE